MASVAGFLSTVMPALDINSSLYRLLKYIFGHSMNGRPIKIIALKNLVGGSRKFYVRLPTLTRVLRNRFGIILKAIRTPKSLWISHFVTLAKEPMETVDKMRLEERPGRILLQYVLTYLFVRGEKVLDLDLFNALRIMGIDMDGEDKYFGSGMRNLIEESFVDMQLLRRERHESIASTPKTFYTWGERAQSLFTYEIVIQYDYEGVNRLLDEINKDTEWINDWT